jgi:hypothetical protein
MAQDAWVGETLSAQELIDALQNIPAEHRDLPVVTEGCDCNGAVKCITLDLESGNVYIERPKE